MSVTFDDAVATYATCRRCRAGARSFAWKSSIKSVKRSTTWGPAGAPELGAAVPLPVRTIDVGDDCALLVSVSVADRGPAACGAKRTVAVQVAPGETLPQLVALRKKSL